MRWAKLTQDIHDRTVCVDESRFMSGPGSICRAAAKAVLAVGAGLRHGQARFGDAPEGAQIATPSPESDGRDEPDRPRHPGAEGSASCRKPGLPTVACASPPAPNAGCAPETRAPAGRVHALAAYVRPRGMAAGTAGPRPAPSSTGAALPSRGAPDRRSQGPMTPAALPTPSVSPHVCRGMRSRPRTAVVRAWPPRVAPTSLFPLPPGQPPLHASLSCRPRRAWMARGLSAHRSSGLNDQAHADRFHTRGRNPRGGAGR